MFNKKIEYQEIESLLSEWAGCQNENETLVLPLKGKKPMKPQIVETPAQWDNYLQSVNNYEAEETAVYNRVKQIQDNIKDIKQQIITRIPPNTWVKVSGDRYIGYQFESWPGHVHDLLIKGKEERLSKFRNNA